MHCPHKVSMGWRLRVAGREGFEPSRELYTPYPLSRRVLSTTQPPPHGLGGRESILSALTRSPYLGSDGGTRRPRGAADVGPRPEAGLRCSARPEKQGLVHAGRREPERGFLSHARSRRPARAAFLRISARRAAGRR